VQTFTYDALPGRVVFAVGAFGRLTAEIERLGAEAVFVVTGPNSAAIARGAIELMGERYVGAFTDLQLHVPAEAAERASTAASEAGADCVVTIGGGSATGYGKVIALAGLPLVAVPTTYSGSEMTPVYGITSGGRKRTTRDLRVLPTTVIYDPGLTTELAPSVTGASGMNAMAHCVEALYADGASPIMSLMAEEGVRALARGIPASVRSPNDVVARSEALYGAYLAGASLAVTGMAIHHRVCHVLGGTFGLVHGDVNSVILPQAAKYNEEAAPGALSRVAEALGVQHAPSGLFDLVAEVGAPTSLKELGVKETDLDEAARLSVDPPPWNPRPVDEQSVRALLDDAYHGRRPAPPS
jgi:maleylacetate reductase